MYHFNNYYFIKIMSQIQIKQIIASFSKVLDLFEFTPVSPEEFRLAKFNKQNVVIFYK